MAREEAKPDTTHCLPEQTSSQTAKKPSNEKRVLIASEHFSVPFVLAHYTASEHGLKPYIAKSPHDARKAAASGFFRLILHDGSATGREAVKHGWMYAHLVSADVSKVGLRYLFDMEGAFRAFPWANIQTYCRALRDGTLEEHAPPFHAAVSVDGPASDSLATPALTSAETNTLASESREPASERKQPECDLFSGPTVVREPDRTVTIELRADRTVIVNGRTLPKLRRAEAQLLHILHRRRPGMVRWSTIIGLMWRKNPPADPQHTAHTHLKRLRRKFGPDGDLIVTVKGVGVRLLLSRGSAPSSRGQSKV